MDAHEYCECKTHSSVTGGWDEWGYEWLVCMDCGKELEGSREYCGEGCPPDEPDFDEDFEDDDSDDE